MALLSALKKVRTQSTVGNVCTFRYSNKKFYKYKKDQGMNQSSQPILPSITQFFHAFQATDCATVLEAPSS